MAYYSKEIYEAKERWALNKQEENIDKAIENGATEEQAEAIARLCSDRHYIHCHSDHVFLSETQDSTIICKMLNNINIKDDININHYLTEAGLPSIEYTCDFINDMWDDSTYQYSDMTREEAMEQTLDVMEQFDQDIIHYIMNFDKKFNTSFAPTGFGKLDLFLR